MKTVEYVALGFGALGILVSVIIYQQKKGRKLLLWKLASDLVWLIQYLLLGKYTGAGSCVVGVVRESVFLNQHKRWAQSKLWLLFFLLLNVTISILTWGSAYSALPMIASAVSVFSFWRANPTLTKILAYPISICMLIYNLLGTGDISYMGVANEVLVLLSTTVSLIGVAKDKRRSIAVKEQSDEPTEAETQSSN